MRRLAFRKRLYTKEVERRRWVGATTVYNPHSMMRMNNVIGLLMNGNSKIGPTLSNKFAHTKFSRIIPDPLYLRIMYRGYFGKKLNLKDPKSFNEKLQWLKIHDRNPLYASMVDKYEVKEYIEKRIGKQYVVPVYGIWDSFDQIDFSMLPNEFVIKCTHDSGCIVICRDKTKLDINSAREKIERSMKRNFYFYGREWPYKNVKPRILAEKLLVDESGVELRDYKVLCFEGKAKLIEFHQGRYTENQSQDYYDVNWNKLNISQGNTNHYSTTDNVASKPSTLNEMIYLSEVLAKGIHHIRVDWYSVCGKLYFGELTFYDGSGFVPFDNYNDDVMLGSWINL